MKYSTYGLNLLSSLLLLTTAYFPFGGSVPWCEPDEGDLDLSKPPCDCLYDKEGGWLVYNTTYIRDLNMTNTEVTSLYTSSFLDSQTTLCFLRRQIDDRLYCPLFSLSLHRPDNAIVTIRDIHNDTDIKRWSRFSLDRSHFKYCDCNVGEIPTWKQEFWDKGTVSWKAVETTTNSVPDMQVFVWLEQDGKPLRNSCNVDKSDRKCNIRVESLSYDKSFKVCLRPDTVYCRNETVQTVCSEESRLNPVLLFERFAIIKDDLKCERPDTDRLTLSWSVRNQYEVIEADHLIIYRVSLRDKSDNLIYNVTTKDFKITSDLPVGISKRTSQFEVEICLTTGKCSTRKMAVCPSIKEQGFLEAYVIPLIITFIVLAVVVFGIISFYCLKSSHNKFPQTAKKPTDADEVFVTIYARSGNYALPDQVVRVKEEDFDHIEWKSTDIA